MGKNLLKKKLFIKKNVKYNMKTTEITDYKKAVENIREALKSYIQENNIKSLILGVSGGIDSALCAALARPVCDELEIELIGRSITIHSNKEDEIERAREIGKNFCHNFLEISMMREFILLNGNLNPSTNDDSQKSIDYKIRAGNIKARLRMIHLYNLAHQTKGMVLSTDNFTELLLSFFTLHGDVGDYGMIQNVWKTEVYDMARYIAQTEFSIEAKKALLKCADASATDGLGITDTDLDQILPDWKTRHNDTENGYGEVDNILKEYLILKMQVTEVPFVYEIEEDLFKEREERFEELKQNPVIKRMLKTEFKRNNPYNITREEILE